MEIKYHSVVIFVSDIEKSKRFYTEVLNMKIEMDMGKNIILENGVTLWEPPIGHIINKSYSKQSQGGSNHPFELCFETDDIDIILKKLKKNNVELLHEIREESWGQRTVRFYDPDKNIIEIGEYLATFLCRMQNEGMNIKQIVEKTGMQAVDVKRVLEQE